MTQKKGLLIDIGVTIIVFMIATITLGVVYNDNVESGTDLQWTDIDIYTVTDKSELQNKVLASFSANDLTEMFPNAEADIDWNTHFVLAYVGNLAPINNYSYEITEGQMQGSTATLKYRFSFPDVNDVFPFDPDTTLQNHPVLFVALERPDIDLSSQFTFRFQNADTNETHSLTIFDDESPANN